MSLRAIEAISDFITDSHVPSPLEMYNIFDLDLKGAETFSKAQYFEGAITAKQCYRRDGKLLPVEGAYKWLIHILSRERLIPGINDALNRVFAEYGTNPSFAPAIPFMFPALEAMVNDGWVKASHDPNIPMLRVNKNKKIFRLNTDPPVK